MKRGKLFFFTILMIGAGVFFFIPQRDAEAVLLGETVQADYLFSDISTVNLALGQQVVGGGVEFVYRSLFNIDMIDTGFVVTYLIDVNWNSFGTFNGFRIMDWSNTITDFTSFDISDNGGTSYASYMLSFDANNLWVNHGTLGERFTAGDTITFTVNGTAVPEPATVALLGIGLVGLAGAEARRRRKKKAVDNS